MMTKKHLHTLADQEDREKYRMVRVSPTLYRALSDLAADEDLRLSTLVALLINAGLDYRNAQAARGRSVARPESATFC